MKIGIAPVLTGFAGGNYQYSLTMLEALIDSDEGDHFVMFTEDESHPIVQAWLRRGYEVRPLRPPSLKRSAKNILIRVLGTERLHELWEKRHASEAAADPDLIRKKPEMTTYFQDCGIEFMIYPSANVLSFEAGVPYVLAVHDLQHRLQPEFPEVSANGEYERREYVYRNGCRHATLVLADSKVGKEDILNCYAQFGINEERVCILPFLPAHYLALQTGADQKRRVLKKYDLPEKFLFYPAQFWDSKNHVRIVQALGTIKRERKLSIPVLFCGATTGELRKRVFQEVMKIASQEQLDVRYPGFVPDEDISAMYAAARALVMPTFFGPTNIPLLEAWAFGCPVITSDIRGIREQMGDAALLVDPRSVAAIADAIFHLWTNDDLCNTLAQRGRAQLAQYTPRDYRVRLFEIIRCAAAALQPAQMRKVK
jgi:glycosyltransferase involved in cell wall biosynthesis